MDELEGGVEDRFAGCPLPLGGVDELEGGVVHRGRWLPQPLAAALRALFVLRKRRQRGGAKEDFAGHKCERDAVEDDVEAQAVGGAAGGRRRVAGQWMQHAAMRGQSLPRGAARTQTFAC